ncbi:hypothetical protein niasHT_010265 [Heterodera trifolii]|uniref:Pre-mRNA-processing factor 19 n=1 Tax=Heterodera trifolii TaxID=157864 RepID=A0ABD2LR41_9BILA
MTLLITKSYGVAQRVLTVDGVQEFPGLVKIDAESLEKFYIEKNEEAHAELDAVDQILNEPFLLGSALAAAAVDGGGGGGDDDDDDDDDDDSLIVVGEDANGPPKKKTKRGGKKYRQLRDKAKELRASTVESASVVSTSSINTSKFKKSLSNMRKELRNFASIAKQNYVESTWSWSIARQQRAELPEGLRTVEQIEKSTEGLKFQGIHNGAICAVDFQNKYILSGGVDKYVALNIFDVADTQRKTFVGHLAKISKVLLHPSIETFVSGAFDSQIRIWNVNQCNAIHTISIHGQAVNDLSFHPTGDYVLCSSEDSHWSLIDLNAGRPLVKVKANDDLPGICCGQFHPDGLIFGTCGKNGVIKFWDIKTQKIMTQYEGHQGAVGAISFSENGYYLATGSKDGQIKIWDLRKHAVLVNLSPFEENNAVNCLTFDYSGNYLAVGGPNTQIYRTDEWKQICQLNTHTQEITGLKFAHNANMVISSSLDGNICACF